MSEPIEAGLQFPYAVSISRIHGRGLFAARQIVPDEQIGVYEGTPTHEDGTYVLWVEDEQGEPFGIKGRNELRYVNHSSEPNAIFLGDELIALREIPDGEEITFDYGDEWTAAD